MSLVSGIVDGSRRAFPLPQGDFNDWNRDANPMSIDDWGIWHLFLPDKDYSDRLTHGSRVKVHVKSALGEHDRIPTYIKHVVQETETEFTGQYWSPPTVYQVYQWKHESPQLDTKR